MRVALGLLLALLIGIVCRVASMPAPAPTPPTFARVRRVLAIAIRFVTTERVLRR